MSSVDLRAIKRARLDQIRGQETINQVEHVASAGAKLVYTNCLVPGTVITADISAAPVLVEPGSILRIQTAGDTYIAFSADDSLGAVSSSTSPGLKLPVGYHVVIATDNFIRASAAVTRLEVVKV